MVVYVNLWDVAITLSEVPEEKMLEIQEKFPFLHSYGEFQFFIEETRALPNGQRLIQVKPSEPDETVQSIIKRIKLVVKETFGDVPYDISRLSAAGSLVKDGAK